MGRILRRVAGRPHVTDQISFSKQLTFVEPGRITIEMRVVVAIPFLQVELVDRQSTWHARKELPHDPVVRGKHRRPPRREDVERLVPSGAAASRFREGIVQRAGIDTGHRHQELMWRRSGPRVAHASVFRHRCRRYHMRRSVLQGDRLFPRAGVSSSVAQEEPAQKGEEQGPEKKRDEPR